MLYFESFIDFETTIESLLYQSDSMMDTWEDQLNFTSLRATYEALTPETKNLVRNQRISSTEFETILNNDSAFRIEDTVYYFKLLLDTLIQISVTNGNTVHRPLENRDGAGPCDQWKSDECGIYYSPGYAPPTAPPYFDSKPKEDDLMLELRKYSEHFSIYSAFGLKMWCYEWVDQGNGYGGYWNDKKISQLSSTLDPWNWIRYRIKGNSTSTYLYGWKTWIQFNDNKVSMPIDYRVGALLKKYCVQDFRRIHFYIDNFYDDFHHEHWKVINLGSYCYGVTW